MTVHLVLRIIAAAAIAAACCAPAAQAQTSAADCMARSHSEADFVGCVGKQHAAEEARAPSVVSKRTDGDWEIETGADGAMQIGARATSERGGATLVLTCSDQSGFAIALALAHGSVPPGRQPMYVLTDASAPVAIDAMAGGELLPVLIAHNAESVERAIASARRIGIRFDEGYGSIVTYYFDFGDLAAGRDELSKVCPS